jgi:hypothetical protein
VLLSRNRHGGDPAGQAFLLQPMQHLLQGLDPHPGIRVGLQRVR